MTDNARLNVPLRQEFNQVCQFKNEIEFRSSSDLIDSNDLSCENELRKLCDSYYSRDSSDSNDSSGSYHSNGSYDSSDSEESTFKQTDVNITQYQKSKKNIDDQELYQQAGISIKEFLFAFYPLIFKHKLSNKAASDMLNKNATSKAKQFA
jgi:hypothetical protein